MGQLRVVYRATGEFMAIAARDQLQAHGIHSVQLLNEIPMQPGFTFELRHWADVLVDEQQYAEARQLVAELELAVAGSEAPQADWPPAIKVHTTRWLGVVWIGLLAASYIQLLISNVYGLELGDIGSPRGAFIWLAPDFLLVICLAALNWRMLGRQVGAAIGGLLALPVIVVWAAVQLASWLLGEVIRYGESGRRLR